MGNYKIKFNINIEDIMDSTNIATVNIEKEITEEQATSIDGIDKALAQINYEAIREMASKHLENLSKKNSN